MKQPTHSFSAINYSNRFFFLILVISASSWTVSKSLNHCCTVFVLHVTISPEASAIPKPFIIK